VKLDVGSFQIRKGFFGECFEETLLVERTILLLQLQKKVCTSMEGVGVLVCVVMSRLVG